MIDIVWHAQRLAAGTRQLERGSITNLHMVGIVGFRLGFQFEIALPSGSHQCDTTLKGLSIAIIARPIIRNTIVDFIIQISHSFICECTTSINNIITHVLLITAIVF